MSLPMRARSLIGASMLALAILSVPVVRVHAEDACTPSTCGDKTCVDDLTDPDHIIYYRGGETAAFKGADGQLHIYMCDGFTGQWVLVGDYAPPSTRNPLAPQSGSIALPPPPTPTSPVVPHPVGNGSRTNAPTR